MKTLIFLIAFCLAQTLLAQNKYPAEGKWVLEQFPNTMHILEGGVRYTYYCTSGNCDSLYNTFEAGDANAISGTETYTFDNNILTTVFSGGPYIAPVEWECEGNIMKFTNINGTVRWIKLNTNVNNCITSEILELSGKTSNDYIVSLNNAEKEKADSIIAQAEKLEDEFKPVSDWHLAIIDGTPSTYSKVQNGYTDENGKIYTITNEELSNFIKWFCGYDVINKQKTPNSYQETSGVTVLAQYSYVSSLGKTETFQKTITSDFLVKRLTQNVTSTKFNFSDMTTKNYWGNIYYIRKVFMDYYDDYIASKI
ncbi:MAG: hypothetical protein NT109_03625 [Flavobacteriia bacterium]|nr:hypothetical protein [Flavobacteriia bacterium]